MSTRFWLSIISLLFVLWMTALFDRNEYAVKNNQCMNALKLYYIHNQDGQ